MSIKETLFALLLAGNFALQGWSYTHIVEVEKQQAHITGQFIEFKERILNAKP